MRNNASRNPDNTFVWQKLLENAERIGKWTEQQRKDHFFALVQQEFSEGRRWYREIIKLLIIDEEARKNFIELLNIRLI